ncbi:lipoprotein-releasing ABC transporter permease subunit [Wohlfahrtiimonas larvae]|uniref:Lipoprotein-releasing ABC transporter permease subunit n=1 Tax=Wohlfahrtiimonas larvae TaxID=1157986 RepID=A0ABP9N0I2_9GAMM|nr:lipoprotein-releasing ABC transporter permease subunit [Wohlfahrtiimonas larvae]
MIKLFKPLSLSIGLRYTAAQRKNNFISFISFISIGGIALGLTAIIVVLSVMNGFQQGITEVSQAVAYDLKMTKRPNDGYFNDWQTMYKKVSNHNNIMAGAPFTNGEGLMNANGLMRPVQIEGIDPQYQLNVSNIMQSFDALNHDEPAIILGKDLAQLLDANIGDYVTLITPEVAQHSDAVIPRVKGFIVVDIFNVGMYEYDANTAFIHINEANQIFKVPENEVQGIRLKLHNLNIARSTAMEIVDNLEDNSVLIYSWVDQFATLANMIETEKRTIFIIMSLIVAVAVFNVVSTLVMVVNDKRSEIAILRTLGLSPKSIMAIFMVQGIVIGFWGVLIGTSLGLIISINVNNIIGWIESILGYTVFEPSVYPLSHIPTIIRWNDISMIAVMAFLLASLATIYPAWRAAKTQPAEALRYE